MPTLPALPHEYEPIDEARDLMNRTAIRCAAAGAVTELPSPPWALFTVGAGLAFFIQQQIQLVRRIAAIYGHEPTGRERLLASFGYGSGLAAAKIAAQLLARRAGRVVPVLQALSGGAVSYLVSRALGEATIRYYERKIDPALADEIWQEGDREHA